MNGGTLLRLLVSGEDDRVARAIAIRVRDQIFESPLVDANAHSRFQAKRLRYLHSSIADENPTTSDVSVLRPTCSPLSISAVH